MMKINLNWRDRKMTTINTKVLAVSKNPQYPDKIKYTLASETEPNGKTLNHKCATQYAYPGDEVEVTLKPYNFSGKSGHTIEKIKVTKKGSNHGKAEVGSTGSTASETHKQDDIRLGRAHNNAVLIVLEVCRQKGVMPTIADISIWMRDLLVMEEEQKAKKTTEKASIPTDAVNTSSEDEIPAPVVF